MTRTTTRRKLIWLPNTITLIRMLAGLLLFACMLWAHQITTTHLVYFIAIALTDWIDGWLARRMNARTGWGQMLDPIADKVVLLTAFAFFCSRGEATAWFTVLYFFREILQTAFRIASFNRNKEAQRPTLFINKVKTSLSYLYGVYLFGIAIPGLLPGMPGLLATAFEVIIIVLAYTGFIKSFFTK